MDGDLLQQFLELPRVLRERVVDAMWTRLVWRHVCVLQGISAATPVPSQTAKASPVGTPEAQTSLQIEGAMEVAASGPVDAPAGAGACANSLQLFAGTDVLFATMELVQHALSLVTL